MLSLMDCILCRWIDWIDESYVGEGSKTNRRGVLDGVGRKEERIWKIDSLFDQENSAFEVSPRASERRESNDSSMIEIKAI